MCNLMGETFSILYVVIRLLLKPYGRHMHNRVICILIYCALFMGHSGLLVRGLWLYHIWSGFEP